jgi:hypothetical protein
MKTLFTIAAAACLVASATTAQAATIINFDNGIIGATVDNFYAAQGITFANTQFTTNFGLPGTSGALGIRAPGTFTFGLGNAIVATFTSVASTITIRGIDVGTAGIRIDAFNASNAQIATSSFFGPDLGVGTFQDISVSASGIKSFRLYQPAVNGSDGVLFDNLTFDNVAAVPEPATWAMLLLGMGIVGSAMRRRARGCISARQSIMPAH